MNTTFRNFLTVSLISGAALWSAPSVAQDAVQAGVSAAVRGAVQVARTDAVGRQISSGEAIYMRDAITSGSDSGMQILLMDETVFTIGADSEISIDEFVYDPATGDGSLAANMTKGVMRFVTGKVSDGNPDSMVIKLPVGTIGIRGTIGVVSILTPDQAAQQFPDQSQQVAPQPNQPVVFAALAGPGPLSQTGSSTGSFTFSSPNGSVDLNRPGGAVLATPGQPPVFFIAPPGAVNNVSQSLTGRGTQSGDADGGDGGDDNSADSGTGTGSGGTSSSGSSASGGGTSQSSSGNLSSQSGASKDTSFTQVMTVAVNTNNASQSNDITTGASSTGANSTTFGDIISANAGASSVGSNDNVLSGDITGLFNTYIDLSARTFDIQFRDLNGGGLAGNATFNISEGSTALSDSATGLTIGGSNGIAAGGTGCSSCEAVVTFTGTNSLSTTLTHNGFSGSGTAPLN
ncbi:FecR domain-containing protein [Rhodospirillaceae bacterium KN72]|uniref:FecR domain-containing protein n=1 Tax=Pacificispira spongiicola TaxID=2729598 RepID=A0A7Y0E2A6_9PROT|nr:FecR domain-containing protein [Pacificispira spongiicola]NMM45151.1 FecR domain-containing protein [Pacificispira spongiicola]